MRRSTSQKIVNYGLILVIGYMAIYTVWSILRPFTGY